MKPEIVEELVDELAEVISDSLDVDWSPRTGARALIPLIDRLVSDALEEGVKIGATLAADYAIQKLKGSDHA